MEIWYYRTSSGRQPVREYIASLPARDRAVILDDLDMIRLTGFEAPVCFRKIQGGQTHGKLWEIKTGLGRRQRIFYCLVSGQQMMLLHACKKQKQTTQACDLSVALFRMKEVLS